MRMSIDDLKKECKYCYREIDNSGLEGFRCTNKTVIKTRDSSWCYPKNADEPCSICEYCEPKEEIEMSIEEAIDVLEYLKTQNSQLLSLDVAINTMRKYQKIEQIVSDFKEYQKGISCGFGGEVYMEMVSKVVEDGNVDCN